MNTGSGHGAMADPSFTFILVSLVVLILPGRAIPSGIHARYTI